MTDSPAQAIRALREIAESDDIDNALDPGRNKRVARAALTGTADPAQAQPAQPETASGAEREGWRDVRSAPRDGTDVLLARAPRLGRPVPPIVAGWFDNGEEGGWSSYDDGDHWIDGEPTYWMPLPAAPTAGGSDGR